jgi:hypothetical protein
MFIFFVIRNNLKLLIGKRAPLGLCLLKRFNIANNCSDFNNQEEAEKWLLMILPAAELRGILKQPQLALVKNFIG